MMESWTGTFSLETAALATAAKASATPAGWPSGHRHYPASDFTVHRRSSYYASLKMLSSRIISAEVVNNEGKRSWHLSDGFLYLVLSGKEYFSGGVWPSLDWSRLPGTTVEKKALAAGEGYGKGTRSFVGGTGDGSRGVAAMDFAANASAVTAKKSWFFFDDEIVAMATDLSSSSANAVESSVAQWPLSQAAAPIVVDGTAKPTTAPWKEELKNPHWVHSDGVGYYLFQTPSLWAQRQQQSGAWSDLGVGSSTVQTNPIFSLWIAHGASPSAATYSYALLPGKTAAEVQAWAAAPPVKILAQTSALHAVTHQTFGTVGAVFWKAGAIGKVTVSAPCVLLYTATGNSFAIAAADPGHGATKLTVTVDEPL